MKSKTLFFNKGIILDDLKRFGWISIAYTLFLFLIVPLKVIMINSGKQYAYDYNIIKKIFYFANGYTQILFILIAPVFTAILIFRYIQVKNSSDMIHSLPIKRSVLYRSHTVVGALLLVLPVIINGFICVFLDIVMYLGKYYSPYDVFQWTGTTIVICLVFFFMCISVGMVVGSSIMQGILTYILLVLPVAIAILLSGNLDGFVYGFVCNDDNIKKFSPVTRVWQMVTSINNNNINKISINEIIVYIFVCIILCFIGMFIYNKRKLEAASKSIAFKGLEYVFKYGVTFCAMLVGGIYFRVTEKSVHWLLVGFLIASFIGYFAAEMIVKKSIRVFKNIKGYLIYVVIIILVIIGVKFDVLGYEKKMPALSNVDSIYFSEGFEHLNYYKCNRDVYFDKKDIENIYNFHKQLIEEKSKNRYNNNGGQSRKVIFIYNLKNGSKIQRGYDVSLGDYTKYLKPIYESKEYKKMHYDILQVNSSDIEKITIHPFGNINKQTVIINQNDIKEAVDILKQDINNESYESSNERIKPWADVEFMIDDNNFKKYSQLIDERNNMESNVHLPWEKSYILFDQWLKEKGYLEGSRITSKDISYALVEKVDDIEDWSQKLKNGKVKIDENSAKNLKITDKNQIETCLRNYKDEQRNKSAKYIIGFYSQDGKNIEYGSFSEKDLPDFIVKYFKNNMIQAK
ncbi:DUF6449 domain-containing protein [Clostridium sp. JS66]|uniref:DUF6449 domain-containing protein n=1 Tax=Clostridium sp. JS66 TaxID=3064705 RepID=UPI00298DFCD1|nr:DUF6449 domain-containing protein [Clostridium sp. JS66]WPC40464.1 DUF6449 domain-containing protein [Clostridium sp. JS66]